MLSAVMGGYRLTPVILLAKPEQSGVTNPNTPAFSNPSRPHIQGSPLPGLLHFTPAPGRIEMTSPEGSSLAIPTRRRISGGPAPSMSKSSAVRKLFLPTEEEKEQQEEYDRTLEAEVRNVREASSRRWRIELETGTPSRDYWEGVPADTVPPFYRETTVTPILRSRPRARVPRRMRGDICSARTSESAEQRQPLDASSSAADAITSRVSVVENKNNSGAEVNPADHSSQRNETETGTATVPAHPVENHPCGIHHADTSSPMKQTTIPAFYRTQKRSRSTSDAEDTSTKRRKSSADLPDRPQSAPGGTSESARS